ncbi:MAG: 4-(cytidine 5'-diphospho)-2-C-methyl-D-erythritol kinase [Pseudomonadota bacterium]
MAEPGNWRLARAKVNLTLHLRGQRSDGYHLLDSLVVFPELGDTVSVTPSEQVSLTSSGPFAHLLSEDENNLVLRAAHALAKRRPSALGAAVHLEKHLPVASGIGGGSSDAATALNALSQLWDVEVPDELALALGADVPVCLRAPKAQYMRGVGEILEPAPKLPAFGMVLVNPMVAVPTGAVFSSVEDKCPPLPPEIPHDGFSEFAGLLNWLSVQRNDLQAAAAGACPVIDQVLLALAEAPFARMSGSGATCFAVVEDLAAADHLATRLRMSYEDWWIAAAPVRENVVD